MTVASARPKRIVRNLAMAAVAAVFAFALLALAGCGGSPEPKELYEDKCSTCHGLGTVDNAAYSTPEEWAKVVDRMKGMSSNISDSDAETITEYLATR